MQIDACLFIYLQENVHSKNPVFSKHCTQVTKFFFQFSLQTMAIADCIIIYDIKLPISQADTLFLNNSMANKKRDRAYER